MPPNKPPATATGVCSAYSKPSVRHRYVIERPASIRSHRRERDPRRANETFSCFRLYSLRPEYRLTWRARLYYISNGCILRRISQRETSSWWTTAAIQRCSQTTPKGDTHGRQLGDSCIRSTTVETGHSQRKES